MLAGTRLGPYEVIAPLGRGGMGEVYRARDTRLQRQVAIKILPSDACSDPRFRERFEREARAVAALSHPNVVAIYDVGTDGETPYAAIELLEGETLTSRIAGAVLPLKTVLDFAVQIARGLAAAHDRGIVHRDLKPDNIFVTREGQIKILDFGLATDPVPVAADGETRLAQTEPGMVLGTVGYMSPEQARGERADARSDVFSFGCVLYEMVSARRAFAGTNRIDTLHAILHLEPPDLAASGHAVPAPLDRVIRRCLDKAGDRRFQSARDLVFALEDVSAEHTAPAAQSVPAARRHRWRWAVAAVACIALISSAAWWTTRDELPQPPPQAATTADDGRRLLAVLPFEQITGGTASGFSAGMTQELTSQLSKLSGLRVVGRAAVAQFKDARADLPAMTRELGIGSVVTGSIREDGARVRVNVELLDARSGQLIWSEQYDREGVDVFAAQSEIALRVAEALKASVTLDEQARLGRRPTTSVAAYQLFVRARGMQRSVRASLLESIELLRQAVALDPSFALAFAELAVRYQFLASYGDPSAAAKGLDAGHRAVAVDPKLAQAQHALAVSTFQIGRLQESIAMLQQAVALDPSFNVALQDLGNALNIAGRFDEALAAARRALQLAPNQMGPYYHVGLHLLALDDDARTERFLTAAATRFPQLVRLQILLASLDLRRGRGADALERMRRTVDAVPNDQEALLERAQIATLVGSPDAERYTQPLLADAADAVSDLTRHSLKVLHAFQLHTSGNKAPAETAMDAILAANRTALAGGSDWPMPAMENATVHALRGDVNGALDWIERAYAAGWRDPRMSRLMPMWASLRGNARFDRIVKRMEDDVPAMRARADYSGLP